ncbi:hypothetical protein [uncultured Tateyamaria sp.]|uniref:hypothetical protein n=1 Tax=uncultured Tateyamaria sp. TaxID=455651 RepID=UPI00262D9E6A|nr:hypothetical protein [uncultured Tateyamaria sp.]
MLGNLLARAVEPSLPELDAVKAATEVAPIFRLRLRGVAGFWVREKGRVLGLPYYKIIRGVVSEIMTNGQDLELQRLLRDAASKPLPEFDPKDYDGNTHALTVRLSAEERHWIEHRSAALNMPASALISFLVQEYAKADIASKDGAG